MAIICDPPHGWMYGFPMAIDEDIGDNREKLHEWLIKKGYPKENIESYGDRFYCRFWEEKDK